MVDEREVGKRIKARRLSKGITLQELAKKTGFTRGYLSKVENSTKAPPVSTLITLAKASTTSLNFSENLRIKATFV
jgi:transcriptional regulator with XRE-family HTH domain